MNTLGLVSVIGLVIALLYVQLKWGPAYDKTFSRLVARKRSSIIFYFVIFAVFLSLFSIYVTQYLVPRLQLPQIFLWVYFIGVAAQMICVSVPETGGLRSKIHIMAAGVMSLSVLLQVALLLFVPLSLISFTICLLSLIVMIAIWIIVLVGHKFIRYELALQTTYFLCYLITLLFVSV